MSKTEKKKFAEKFRERIASRNGIYLENGAKAADGQMENGDVLHILLYGWGGMI